MQKSSDKASPVTILTRSDEARVVALITLAFADDPVARWSYRSAEQYLAYFPRLIRAFGGGAFDHGGAHGIDHIAGAALWLPPGVGPDEAAMGTIIEESVPPDELPEVMAVIEQMNGFHPHEPHWHLPLIGVDPRARGRGLGSQLLAHMAAACDRDRLPAYLEATSSRNVPLYERHGFERIGTIQAGKSPQIVPMVRRPK